MLSKKFRLSLLFTLSLLGLSAIVFASYQFGLQAGAKHYKSSDHGDLLDAKVVSLAELAILAADRPVFYQGSNRHFHYLRLADVGYLRLRHGEVTIPQHGFDGDGSADVGMIWRTLYVENGKLKSTEPAPGAPGGGGLF
jgi:hypothetical protein